MIPRIYSDLIDHYLTQKKVLVIYGPRQVGKTTLIKNYLETYDGKIFRGTGDDAQMQRTLSNPDLQQLKVFFNSYDLLFIDEAQMIPQVGRGLKLLHDELPEIKIIVTGSSSFDLSNRIGEPLVGRQIVKHLYPLSMIELDKHLGWYEVVQRLPEFLVYGTYPEVLNIKDRQDKIDYLSQIRDSYLFKDLLILENLKNSNKLNDLLRLIAFQVGQQVSHQELGTQLGMSKNTVARYLELLEKAFVLINVNGFSRNLRKEITKTSRYYFYDLGVRNAVINNFNDLDFRNDVGQLWENFIFLERMKKRHYHKIGASYYFWRTYNQKEIDLVEEGDGAVRGYEIKFNKKKVKPPKDWTEGYPNAEFHVINRDNFRDYVI